MLLGGLYYVADRRAACERNNDVLLAIDDSFDRNAENVGIALAVVMDAPKEALEEYLSVFSEQPKPEAIQPREC
jgi:hypothetical protein